MMRSGGEGILSTSRESGASPPPVHADAGACLVMPRCGAPWFDEALAVLWGFAPEEREALATSSGLGARDAFAAIVARRLRDPGPFEAVIGAVDPFASEPTHAEYALADGRVVEATGVPVRDERGAVTARALLYRDVTANHRHAAALTDRAARETALAHLARVAIAADALAPVAETAVALLAETMGVRRAALLELDADRDRLVLRSAVGFPAAVMGEALAGASARAALDLLASGPLVAPGAAAAAGPAAAVAACAADAACACVLVRGRDAPFGALATYSAAPRAFDPDDLGFLDAVASILGSAIARQDAERESAEGETLLRAVFDGTQDGIHVADDEGRILDANPAAAALLGVARDALVGRGLPSFVRPAQHRQVAVAWERFLADGRQQGEIEVVVRGGARTLEYAAVAHILPGRHLTVLRDVTEQRQLSARIALTEKMISVGTLAAGVAHELNNPLAYVAANLTYVADGLRDLAAGADAALLDEMDAAVREARGGAERMRIIIRDLLALSRSDESTRGPVDLTAVLESCLSMAHNEIRHRAVLVKELARVPPVVGNAPRLSQVFLNLLVNAAQSIPEGAAARNRVRVATRRARDGRVVVEVEDSGCGIAPEDLPRIFDPFFTTKPVGAGTGLGLSVTHHIVSSYGGEIEVESEPGRGTTFRVLLAAAADADERPASVPPRPPAGAQRARLLVVDDEPLVGVALRRALGTEHEVVVAASAPDALALVKGGDRFDLILSDLLMPDMTGMDLHAALEHDAPGLARHMLFLTGGAFTPAAHAFLEAHRDGCLEKPFEVAALRDLVRRRLAEARAAAA
jgi:PAS domain S-box-containing protein